MIFVCYWNVSLFPKHKHVMGRGGGYSAFAGIFLVYALFHRIKIDTHDSLYKRDDAFHDWDDPGHGRTGR